MNLYLIIYRVYNVKIDIWVYNVWFLILDFIILSLILFLKDWILMLQFTVLCLLKLILRNNINNIYSLII